MRGRKHIRKQRSRPEAVEDVGDPAGDFWPPEYMRCFAVFPDASNFFANSSLFAFVYTCGGLMQTPTHIPQPVEPVSAQLDASPRNAQHRTVFGFATISVVAGIPESTTMKTCV